MHGNRRLGLECSTRNMKLSRTITTLILLILVASLVGCTTTPGQAGSKNNDPLEPANRELYNFNETLDQYIFKPVAETYVGTFPRPVRVGVTNFFDNVSYLNVTLNSFLQGKFMDGFSDVTRIVVNSTIGIGGLFDVATRIGLPRHDEDTGQTLAVWGVGEGAYLFIPGTGSDTVRDLPNMVSSTLLFPFTYFSAVVLFPLTAVAAVNTRANMLEASSIRDTAALDPYSFTREAYLLKRQHLINDGNTPLEEYYMDNLEDESDLLIED